MLTILSLTCNIRYFSLIFTATVVKPYFLTFHGRRTFAAATGIAQKRKSGERENAEAPFVLNMSITADYGCFSLDVIASMLVHRPIKKKLLGQFDSIIMQTVSHHLRLFCAPTWPSYDVIGEHLLINKSAMLHIIQQARC